MNCKNCDHSFEGKFCSQCGQNSMVDRINLPNFLDDISNSVFQINKGFFYTLKELFLRPGKSLKGFLLGKRKSHAKPLAYALILSTVYFLITQFTNQTTIIEDFIAGLKEAGTEAPSILKWAARNYAYASLLLVPIFSLASYLAFFKFKGNYLEHIVINSYITGHQAIFYSLFAIVGAVTKSDIVEIFQLSLSILYAFWVFWQLFSEGNRAVNILRSLLTYVLFFIVSIGLLLAILGIS